MSFFNCFSYSLVLLFVLISIHSSLQDEYEGSVIKRFSIIQEKEDPPPKSSINDMGLPARRTKCSAATKSSTCSEHSCKIIFGTPGKPVPYEFEYKTEKAGITSVRKWGIKCPSKPVMFLTEGKGGSGNFEVMIHKES